jgi:deoxyribonuclease-4
MSVSGGLETAIDRAEQVDSDAVQIFTKNQRQWRAKPLTDEQIAAFRDRLAASATIKCVVAHDSYLINLASPKDDIWEKSIAGFREELERCELLGVPYLVTHPGAHTGSGRDAGVARVIEALDRIHGELPGYEVKTLLETTAGQGTTLGGVFEDLAEIRTSVAAPERVGVCMDTCHIFVAGYDIRTPETYAETMGRFDELVGIDHLFALHFNDAKADLGSHLDRHEYIGQGTIGADGFRNFMNDGRLAGRPALLETEKDDDLTEDREAIILLRSLVKN